MKFAVLGAFGQLGRDLVPRLPGEVLSLGREQADLTRPDMLRETLSDVRPDVVVNCAAYNYVDRAETEAEAAFAVNVWGVQKLALVCRDLDCVLVHFSTNYVFGLDQDRRFPYNETDSPGPVSVYGLSKLAGEYFVRALCRRHLVIRTCGLFGVHGLSGKGTNFVETMLRGAAQGKPLRVVSDQVCTPSYTIDVAEASAALIQTGRYGLYHLTNSGQCSWHEFARTIFELAGVQADLSAVTSEEFAAPARRPAYSVLAMTAYEALGLPKMRPWQEALAAYFNQRREK